MGRSLHGGMAILTTAMAVSLPLLVAQPPPARAAQALTARVLPEGQVSVMDGQHLVALLTLNVHGPKWVHAGQARAMASIRPAASGHGQVVDGDLAVPDGKGGAIHFVETVSPGGKGFTADYDLSATEATPVNGLQISVLLPIDRLLGKTILVHALPDGGKGAKSQWLTVPAKLDDPNWQLFTGAASRIDILPGKPDGLTLVASIPGAKGKAAQTNFLVQDLRGYDQQMIEVRFFLIMKDNGTTLSADQKFRAALDFVFGRKLEWE